MSDPQHDIRIWAQGELAKRGHGAKGALAKFLDVRPDAITRMTNTDPEKETREIRAHELVKMRQFFTDETETGDYLTTVPLVGYVSAGARAYFNAENEELERVPAPKDPTPYTVAVEIHGDSLGALFDMWLVYYDDDQVRSPVTSDMIGRLCVVGLPDDRVLVKRIRHSRTPGFYHLDSNTEPTINDVEITWAAKVKSMEPR
jgi:hypothetical protein